MDGQPFLRGQDLAALRQGVSHVLKALELGLSQQRLAAGVRGDKSVIDVADEQGPDPLEPRTGHRAQLDPSLRLGQHADGNVGEGVFDHVAEFLRADLLVSHQGHRLIEEAAYALPGLGGLLCGVGHPVLGKGRGQSLKGSRELQDLIQIVV